VRSDENLTVWNTQKYSNSVVADANSTSFCWSPDGSLLAIGFSNGSIKILNIITAQITSEFENLSTSAIVSLVFTESGKSLLLLSIDADSNVVVSNPDRNVAKLHFYQSSHFSSVNGVLAATRNLDNKVFLVGSSHVLCFTPKSGNFTDHKLPFQVSNTQDVSLTASSTQLAVQLDKNTIAKYKISGKTRVSTEFVYKKRFTSKVTSLSCCYDEKTIAVTFIDGSVYLMSQDGKSEIKLKVKLKSEVSPHKQLKADEKLHKASSILAAVSTPSTLTLSFGESWTNPTFESFDIAEVFTLADKNIVCLERSRSESQKGQINELSAKIQSFNVDVSTAGKRKRKDIELKTIGESLDQRLKKDNSDMKDTELSIYDKSTSLMQALHADDSMTVTSIIKESQTHQEIIRTTLSSLTKDFIPSLLSHLESHLKSSPESSTLALNWLNSILKSQSSYLLTQKQDLLDTMQRIQEMSKRKNKLFFVLDELEGKLDYFLNNETETEFNLIEENSPLQPEHVYHADADDPEFESENESDDEEEDDSSEDADDVEMDVDDISGAKTKMKKIAALATPSTSENEEEIGVN